MKRVVSIWGKSRFTSPVLLHFFLIRRDGDLSLTSDQLVKVAIHAAIDSARVAAHSAIEPNCLLTFSLNEASLYGTLRSVVRVHHRFFNIYK